MRIHHLAAALVACMASRDVQGQPASRGVALDDVLASALARNANVLVARTLSDASDGARVAAAKPFDLRLSALVKDNRSRTAISSTGSPALVAEPNHNLTSSLVVDRAFRAGPSLRSTMQLERLADGTSLSTASLNQTSASIDLTLPLLKGRGVGQAAAYERSARQAHDGSVLDERHEAAAVALAAALAYWDYLAAYRRLDIYRQSEERSARLAEET